MPVYLNCSAGNGRPAARVGDSVSCSKHGTVSIVSGSQNTQHDGKSAARVGDKTSCGATILEGSDSVLINGKPAAFVGCATTHGGKITSGSPTIFVGKAEIGTDLDKDLEPYSMSLDLSTMHEAGNHNDISYDRIAVEITKPDGTYITTISTDEHGITSRFYTKEQEEIIAWADFGHWEVSEEFEVIDCDDAEEIK
ncbi:PAAR domain-containing protein [Pelotalea chapellei]|uniref:PAAR domain-containing protein n=1 Tax=Pelotalea chapellei TaxID=44671 RepID=A0ABS5U599_9BACT|nr:PAAR domain-containing protein [Pelotalea chapellei]MBT1070825.1 PAAR domain-containing protein [Pelotalea chapellei]